MENDSRLLRAADVAALLGNCHIQTVYKLASSGVLPSLKIGSWRRFKAADIAAWLNDRTVKNDIE
jgi:excisionase family DNA binding protein